MTIVCPTNDTVGICSTLDSTGAGLGVFLQYLGASLPVFLITLGIIAGVVAIVFAIASLIKGSIHYRHK